MGLKDRVKGLTKPVEELDREKLAAFCQLLGVTPMDDVEPRSRVRVGGEVRSVRIVPRAGAPALEVTVTDGVGSVTGVFLGRRKIVGIAPGRKICLDGVAGKDGPRLIIYNPVYTLLP